MNDMDMRAELNYAANDPQFQEVKLNWAEYRQKLEEQFIKLEKIYDDVKELNESYGLTRDRTTYALADACNLIEKELERL